MKHMLVCSVRFPLYNMKKRFLPQYKLTHKHETDGHWYPGKLSLPGFILLIFRYSARG